MSHRHVARFNLSHDESGTLEVSLLACVPLAAEVVPNGTGVNFDDRISEDFDDAPVVQEVPRSVRRAFEEAAVDHAPPQGHMVDRRTNRVEPVGQSLVYLPFGIRATPGDSAGSDGEDYVQMIGVPRKPLEATRLK